MSFVQVLEGRSKLHIGLCELVVRILTIYGRQTAGLGALLPCDRRGKRERQEMGAESRMRGGEEGRERKERMERRRTEKKTRARRERKNRKSMSNGKE